MDGLQPYRKPLAMRSDAETNIAAPRIVKSVVKLNGPSHGKPSASQPPSLDDASPSITDDDDEEPPTKRRKPSKGKQRALIEGDNDDNDDEHLSHTKAASHTIMDAVQLQVGLTNVHCAIVMSN